MCLGVGLFASILFETLCFLDLHVCFLHQIRKVSFHYFFIHIFNFLPFLFSFWHPVMQMLEHLKLSHRLLTLSLFFWIFFLVVLIGCFLLPYVPNHWFDSQLHPHYWCFPVNCSLFQLVYPSCLSSIQLDFWWFCVMVVLYFSCNFNVVLWEGEMCLPMLPSWLKVLSLIILNKGKLLMIY